MEPHAQLSSQRADARPTPRKRRRLGKQLIKQGIVPKSVVRAALEEQELSGARLGEILVARGAIDQFTLAQALAYQDVVGLVGPADRPTSALPVTIAFEHRAVALETNGNGAGGPAPIAVTDLAAVPAIWETLGQPIEPKLADPDTMERLLSEAYPDSAQADVAPPVDEDVALVEEPEAEAAPEADTEDGETPEHDELSELEAESDAEVEPAPEVPGAPAEDPEPAPVAEAAAAPAEPAPTPAPVRAPVAPVRRSGLLGLFGRRSQERPSTPRTYGGRPATPAPPSPVAAAPSPVEPAPPLEAAAVGPEPDRNGDAEAFTTLAVAHGPLDAQPEQELVAQEVPDATVIVGLRQASPATLMRLREVLESIEYPREHLQVVAVQDPADHITRRALRDERLPAWVSEAVVSRTDAPGPRGMLLCGLRRARGELVMVVRAGSRVNPDLLRNVASGLDEYALMSRDELTARRLTNAFLRQAEPPRLEPLLHDNTDAGGPECVFRTAELREAFGWTAATARAH